MPTVLLTLALGVAIAVQAAETPSGSWDLEQRAVYLADLSRATPASALSKDGRPGTWKVFPFSTASVSGNMLLASPSPRTPTPELRLPVPARGLHAVYVGINYQFIWHRPQLLKLRFASDPAFSWLVGEGSLKLRRTPQEVQRDPWTHTDRDIVEVLWKVRDLTGEDLVIARKAWNPLRLWHAGTDFNENIASMAYLKLVPLSPREAEDWRRRKARPDTKRILGINDMGWLRWVRSREELHEELEPLRDSDIETMMWGTWRGFWCSYFRTQAGAVPAGGDNEFQKFFSTFGEGMDRFRQLKIDPLEEAVAYAHRIGIKLVAAIRMDGPKPPPYDGGPGPFFDQHPEYRLIAPDGTRTLRLSLAYPEVRRQYLALFREALAYGVDGISLVFTRNFPFVGYEKPVLDTYQGPRDDEGFRLHQASFVTSFLREIRTMLDQEGARRNQRLQLIVYIGGNPPAQPYQPSAPGIRHAVLEFGWDVQTWVAQNLIDALVLHPWHEERVTDDETRGLSAWTRGSKTKFYVDFFPEELDTEGIRRDALRYYDAGADGICLWNTDLRVKRPAQWAIWRMLGHRDELRNWRELALRFFRIVPLTSLGGFRIDEGWWHSTG